MVAKDPVLRNKARSKLKRKLADYDVTELTRDKEKLSEVVSNLQATDSSIGQLLKESDGTLEADHTVFRGPGSTSADRWRVSFVARQAVYDYFAEPVDGQPVRPRGEEGGRKRGSN
jgi:hypothetical protein